MGKKEDETVEMLLCVFDNESAAVGAHAGLVHWDDSRRDIKLGTIGFVQLVDGEVKGTLVRKEGKGALVSGAMGLVKSMLGPIAMVGEVVGGVARSFFKEEKDETPEAFQKLAAYMDAGGVTLIMVGNADEARAYSGQLQAMGGRVTIYTIPQETLDEVAAAVAEAEAQAAAAEEAA